jgi:hypothetical protein
VSDDPPGRPNERDDELVLPEETSEAEAVRQRKAAAIPDKSKTSGMVRRQLAVGDLKKRPQAEPFQLPAFGEAHAADREAPVPGTAEKPEAAKAPGAGRPVVREGAEIGKSHPPSRPIDLEVERPGMGAEGSASAPSMAVPQPRRRRKSDLEGEEAWTGNRSSLWFVLAGLICLVVVGYSLAAAFNRAKGGGELVEPKRSVMKDSISDIPIAEFVERSAELLPIVAEIMERANRSEGEELGKLLRGGAESAARLQAWRERKLTPARHLPLTHRQLHAAAVGGTGYLILVGYDADYLVAAAYFAKEGEEFKYDWEASEGYGELLPGEEEGLSDEEPRLMRVVASLSDFYTPQFPEREYRCYSFHHQDPGVFVWGFAKRDSLVDRSLFASYSAPDLVGTERRMTIRVRKGPEGARPNQLEVVEFLHTDWLEP